MLNKSCYNVFFYILNLIYRKLIFWGLRGGPQFPGGGGGGGGKGVQLFLCGGEGEFNCFFPIETHITCAFRRVGGSNPLLPLELKLP